MIAIWSPLINNNNRHILVMCETTKTQRHFPSKPYSPHQHQIKPKPSLCFFFSFLLPLLFNPFLCSLKDFDLFIIFHDLISMESKDNRNNNNNKKMVMDDVLHGFSPVSTPRIFWKSRRRSAGERKLELSSEDNNNTPAIKKDDDPPPPADEEMQDSTPAYELSELSERRKALFEPLEPIMNINGRRLRPSNESLLPPPDFESANYPKGWLIGKKRKLVNVDVVESMRRIAVQEMNRKDREIDGLNEQLEEDSRCLEHLQLQLLEEKSKRSRVERENAMLQEQVNMLMNMLQEGEQMGDDENEDQISEEGREEEP